MALRDGSSATEARGLPDALRGALDETGAIGATTRQLATRLSAPPVSIASELDRMRLAGEVLQIGRGLWLLKDYERLLEREDFVDPAEYGERFQRENGVGLGRYAGPITFRSNEAELVHRWWPYVQGYSAGFVRGILSANEIPRGGTVLDPFAGSGTTIVEARRAGLRGLGFELLPPAALAARVKTWFELEPGELARRGDRIVRSALRRRAGPLPFLRETRRQFSPRSLECLLRLRGALPAEGSLIDDALRLAFGRILIPSSRLHRSPCLGYGRRESRGGPTPVERFLGAVETMRADLERLQGDRPEWGPPARVLTQDARTIDLPPESIDLAVTSPPYVNGMDYVMNYKVDLAWLGYARSYADLRVLRRAEVACDNLPRSEAVPYLDASPHLDPWLVAILDRIRINVARKGTYRRNDMHAIVHRYFADLAPVLAAVRRALRPGGRFVLVVGDSLLAGTYVPGDLLLARMGERLGLIIESVRVARRRRSGQRRAFELRESVVTLRRPAS